MKNSAPFLIVAANVIKTGGMDRANLAVAEYVARLGIEVHIVSYNVDSDLLEMPNVHHHKVKKILNSETLSEPLIDHTGRFHARRIAARGGRVMVNGGNCRWPDINWVNHVHTADGAFAPKMPLQKIKRHIDYALACYNERRFIPIADTVITSCERTRQDIINLLGVPADKVIAVHLGMNTRMFKPISKEHREKIRRDFHWDQNQPLAIFVGALGNRRKGFDTLYAAWKKLCSQGNWDAKLLVVGRGAEVPMWQSMVKDSGLDNHIQFLGFVDNLAEVVASCDVFISPSRYEGYSLAAQEAVISKVPAIVTSKTGFGGRYPDSLKELILEDPDDVDGLCRIVSKWREDMDYYKRKIEPFAETLASYDWDDMAAAMWETIQSRPAPVIH